MLTAERLRLLGRLGSCTALEDVLMRHQVCCVEMLKRLLDSGLDAPSSSVLIISTIAVR